LRSKTPSEEKEMSGPPEIKKPEPVVDVPRLLKLLEQWTRTDTMARLGTTNAGFVTYAENEVRLRNEIRELLFGTSSLPELAKRWGMVK
jgi:hypothetical protein